MDKNRIADIFEEIAVFLELKGENPFKIRAYTGAARFLQTAISEEELRQKVKENDLDSVPGIGKAIREKVLTLYETENLEFYDKLKESIPQGWLDLLQIPSLGSKKVKLLANAGFDDLEKLKKACQENKISTLKGFGKKTAENILHGIENLEKFSTLFLGIEAREYADWVKRNLEACPEVQRVSVAGSVRRGKEVVKDVDLIVASKEPARVMDCFVNMVEPKVAAITNHGETKSSVRLENGLQVDLRVVPLEVFGFSKLHFTGSKEHNILLRKQAHKLGFKLSEWGMEPIDESLSPVYAESEEQAYEALGIQWIEPVLREGIHEVEMGLKREIKDLVRWEDIQGCFHNHTTASDGHNTLAEMRGAAEHLGWNYLGIADHSKASFQANGLDEERILEQLNQIQSLNNEGHTCHLFSGIECDILKDGSLDIEEQVLNMLDYVVVSVHSRFGLDYDGMTKRIIQALEHPETTMLGHMSGRLLLRRDAYQIDSQKIIDCAIANEKIIELNANPYRLDMDWRLWIHAQEKGLICSINPDAHSTKQLEYVHEGILMARKGYLSKDQIFNTFDRSKIKQILSKNKVTF